jgi:hypothetical protein
MVSSSGRSACTDECLVIAIKACWGVAAESHKLITSIAVLTQVGGVCAGFDDRIMIVFVEVCVASDSAEKVVFVVIAEECVSIVLAGKCVSIAFELVKVCVAVGLVVTEERIARESVISSVGESGVVLVRVVSSVLSFEARRVVVSVAVGVLAGVDGGDGGVGVREIVRKYDSTECKEEEH